MGFFQKLGKNLKHLVGAGGVELKVVFDNPSLSINPGKLAYTGNLTFSSKENTVIENVSYKIEMVTKQKDANNVTTENKENLGEKKIDLNLAVTAQVPITAKFIVGTDFYNVKTSAEQDFAGKGGVMGAIAGLSKAMMQKEVHYYLIIAVKLQGIAFAEEYRSELMFDTTTAPAGAPVASQFTVTSVAGAASTQPISTPTPATNPAPVAAPVTPAPAPTPVPSVATAPVMGSTSPVASPVMPSTPTIPTPPVTKPTMPTPNTTSAQPSTPTSANQLPPLPPLPGQAV